MIALENIVLQAGKFRLSNVSLHVESGCYAVLMGKTGCGKTTLLEALCGLKRVDAGRILLDGRDVTRLKPGERGIGYVPQDGALFTTMTVREHLAFSLLLRKWSRAAITARVNELAALLGIAPLLNRYPFGLSGGESQRVALGRALACGPRILCLDEPLSALDHDTRIDMCALLRSVKEQAAVTVLHVTHDRNEAARVADRTFEFEAGRVVAKTAAG